MVCVTTNANHPFESGHGRAEWYPATDIYVLQYECTTSRWAEHTPHCQHTDTHRTHPHTYTVHTHTHAHMESMALWAHGHNDTGTAGHIDTYTYTCTHIHLHTHTPTHTHTYKHITHITLPYLCIPTAKPKGSTLSSKVRWHSGGKHSELVSFAKSTGTTGRSGYYWYYWWLYAFYLRNPKAPYCHQRWVDTPVNMLSLFPSPSLRLKLSVLSNAHSNCKTQRPRIVVHDGSAGYVFAYVFKYNQTSKFHYPQQLFSLYSSPTNCSQSTPEAA